ncbi:MAG: hypothetical protein AAGD23_11630 [Pseudomonadota bacterium]
MTTNDTPPTIEEVPYQGEVVDDLTTAINAMKNNGVNDTDFALMLRRARYEILSHRRRAKWGY